MLSSLKPPQDWKFENINLLLLTFIESTLPRLFFCCVFNLYTANPLINAFLMPPSNKRPPKKIFYKRLPLLISPSNKRPLKGRLLETYQKYRVSSNKRACKWLEMSKSLIIFKGVH